MEVAQQRSQKLQVDWTDGRVDPKLVLLEHLEKKTKTRRWKKGVQPEKQLAVQARKELPPPLQARRKLLLNQLMTMKKSTPTIKS